MKRRAFLSRSVAAAALAAAPGLARAATAAGAPEDMTILAGALALHPGLYRYLSPGEVERGLAKLGTAWTTQPELSSRYLALSRFLSTIRCGHSYANFFNQRKAVASPLFAGATRLPFHFAWLDGEMVVTRGFASGIAAGSVVNSLNGEAPIALRQRLMPLVRSDGHNDAKRISLLEVRGDDSIETFDVFQGLVAPPDGGRFVLSLRAPDGTERRLDLPAIDLTARRAQRAVAPLSDTQPAWQWRMEGDGTAVLTMPNWGLYDSKWTWKAWLDERLDSLKGARGLVVDLRTNEGGLDCGDPILARLITSDFVPPRSEQRLRFRTTPKPLDPYLDTWDDSFRTMGKGATALPGGFYLRPGGEDVARIAPAGRRITCPVRVLTSPVNSSATFQFASNLRAIGGGKLVGRPTGGNRRGINGGCFFFVRLPESGIEFDLPLVGYFPLQPQPDAGLLPDVAVAETRGSIASGEDRTLATALRSIG